MATPEYQAWNNDGRPITPALTIRESVDQLKVGYPRAAEQHLFSWYADEAHYAADRPQDHTPYSYTPWPVSPQPYPYVTATDIMHRPDLGVDCFTLFNYWITEARAGRTPWVKYYIWQGKIYDSRKNWTPAPSSGHFDHIHRSDRTDWINKSMGGWRIVPGQPQQEDEMIGHLIVDHNGSTWIAPGHFTSESKLATYIMPSYQTQRCYEAAGYRVVDLRKEGNTARLENLPWYDLQPSEWEFQGEVALSDEALEDIGEKAFEGAEAGAAAGSPTHEELVAAAEEGSQLAEDR